MSKLGWSGLALAALVGGCGILTDPAGVPLRIAINLGALAGITQGDFNSVMDRVDVTITDSEGDQQTVGRSLEPGEFDPTFDVEVKEGLATFSAAVSGIDLPLYVGTTTFTVESDGFQVAIVPQAINPVLIVAPRAPSFVLDLFSEEWTWVDTLFVRNSGIAGLEWQVDSQAPLPAGVRITCRLPFHDGISCLVPRLWEAGQTEPIEVRFFVPSSSTPLPTQGVRFLSNVGTLTVPTTP